jgi:transcriptional regulator with XRE-family HTH domain
MGPKYSVGTEQNEPIITDSNQFLPEQPKTTEILSARQEGYALLRQSGLTQADAARVLGVTRARTTQLEKKINRQHDLTSPRFIRLAANAQKFMLQAFVEPDKLPEQLRGDKFPISLKGSDINACIDRVYDRAQPVVHKTQELGSNGATVFVEALQSLASTILDRRAIDVTPIAALEDRNG